MRPSRRDDSAGVYAVRSEGHGLSALLVALFGCGLVHSTLTADLHREMVARHAASLTVWAQTSTLARMSNATPPLTEEQKKILEEAAAAWNRDLIQPLIQRAIALEDQGIATPWIVDLVLSTLLGGVVEFIGGTFDDVPDDMLERFAKATRTLRDLWRARKK